MKDRYRSNEGRRPWARSPSPVVVILVLLLHYVSSVDSCVYLASTYLQFLALHSQAPYHYLICRFSVLLLPSTIDEEEKCHTRQSVQFLIIVGISTRAKKLNVYEDLHFIVSLVFCHIQVINKALITIMPMVMQWIEGWFETDVRQDKGAMKERFCKCMHFINEHLRIIVTMK